MNTTHSAVVVVPDDGTSPVGSDEWNATHYLTVPDGAAAVEVDHFALTTRLTAVGTGRLTVREPLQYFKGAYGMGSVQVLNDNYILQYKRATLAGEARVQLSGNGELYLFDLAPVGRLVLAGRGF